MARFCIEVDCPPCHGSKPQVIDVPWEPVKRPIGGRGLVPALRAQAARLLTGPVKGEFSGLDGACGSRAAWVVSYRAPGSRRDAEVTVCARDAHGAQVAARGRLGARIGSVRGVHQIAGLDGLDAAYRPSGPYRLYYVDYGSMRGVSSETYPTLPAAKAAAQKAYRRYSAPVPVVIYDGAQTRILVYDDDRFWDAGRWFAAQHGGRDILGLDGGLDGLWPFPLFSHPGTGRIRQYRVDYMGRDGSRHSAFPHAVSAHAARAFVAGAYPVRRIIAVNPSV
jgi:hypothetical protein